MRTWTCGDCRTTYPINVHRCQRPFDDYLALRGGSIESAIAQAVGRAIAPTVRRAERRLSSNRVYIGFQIAA